MTNEQMKDAVKSAEEHKHCDPQNCFLAEDAFLCELARALLASQERVEKLEVANAAMAKVVEATREFVKPPALFEDVTKRPNWYELLMDAVSQLDNSVKKDE